MLITQLIREKSCPGLVENHPKTCLTSFDFKKQLENNHFKKGGMPDFAVGSRPDQVLRWPSLLQ